MRPTLASSVLATAFLATLALTGCSNGPATDAYPGGPHASEGDSVDVAAPESEKAFGSEDGPVVGWVERGKSIAVTLWGSGSCPDHAESIEATSDDEIEVTFVPDGDEICTADLGPYTHELDVPAEVTGRPVTVTVREPIYPEGYTVSERVLE